MTTGLTVCIAHCKNYSCDKNRCRFVGRTIYPISVCISLSAGCKDYSPEIDEVETHSGKMPYGGGNERR